MATPLERVQRALAGRYELERELGRGGMATVYLARDLKHARQVAVKILKPELAATLGVDRFLREIHIAANLTHPHILGLHDSGEADGFLFYVMPYVEGESLRQRLAREGELPITDAVRILREVADALAYAHGQGLVHRDIKPDNVMLAGRHAVVTDFGVAKAVTDAAGADGITTAGVAIGTPAYMAPEQAVADPHIDHRADLYAFGVMAYEMLTGVPPFTGDSQHEILAAHVTEEAVPPRAHRDTIPLPLEELVLHCLAKRAADRPQRAEELLPRLEALAAPSGGTTPAGTAPAAAAPRLTAPRTAVLAGALVALAVIGVLGWSSLRHSEPAVTVANVRQVTRAPALEFDPAIAPDGREVAYAVATPVGFDVVVQDLAGGRAIPLSGGVHPRAITPRWTADGRSIVFTGAGRYDVEAFLVPRLGGAARPLGAIRVWDVQGGRAVYTARDTLWTRALDGGEPRAIATGDPHSARWGPDGEWVAWVQGNGFYVSAVSLGNVAPSSIRVARADGSGAVTVVADSMTNQSPAWLDARHLLFVSNRDGARDLYVVRLDRNGRPQEAPRRVTTGLDPHSVSVDRDGRVAAYSRFIFRRNVYRVPMPPVGGPPAALSDAVPVTVGNQNVENHGVSPDGQWLAYDSNLEGNQDIFVAPMSGGEPRRITTDPGDDFHPDFGPDGREIVFYSTRFGTRDVFLIHADGSGETRVTDLPGEEMHPTISPDGRHLAFTYLIFGGRQEVRVLTRETPGGRWGSGQVLSETVSNTLAWSPDGRLLAYGAPDGVTVQPLGGPPRVVLAGRGWDPSGWSADGRVLYVLGTAPDAQGIWAIPVGGGAPQLQVDYAGSLTRAAYFPTIVGRQALITLSEYESDIWTMELRRP